MKNILYIAVFVFSLTRITQESNTLTIQFKKLGNKKGKLFVALYNSESTFLKKEYKGIIVEIKNGKATAVFKDVPKGIYAVSSFHDKNNNGKMDANFMGIPQEDYATSNDAKGFMGPPKFKDAKFKIDADLTITMNY